MLANLELVNCYNTTGMEREERDRIMLASAKENLLRMAYFGLTELQAESHYVFQETFNLTFKVKNLEFNRHRESKINQALSSAQVRKIEELNHLDMKLYEFAKEVMMWRLEDIKRSNQSLY